MKRQRQLLAGASALILALLACTSEAEFVEIMQENAPEYEEGPKDGNASGWNDSLETVQTNPIEIGDFIDSTLADNATADNWELTLSEEEFVIVGVLASGGSDPRLRVFDPNGDLIAEHDDIDSLEEDYSAQLNFRAPVAGTYTLRVDVWTPGDYRISVR